MPEYLVPGVYVEEIDTGNKPIEGVSTSTVGFLGLAEKGPISPTLITSFGEYLRLFGGHSQRKNNGFEDRFLSYAVEGFFQNGGKRCFIQRVVHLTDADATKVAKPASLEIDGKLTVSAIGPGEWGKRIAVSIDESGIKNDDLFKLTVRYWKDTPPNDFANPATEEVFDNLSSDPLSTYYYVGQVTGVSELIELKQKASGKPNKTSFKKLDGGQDGDNPKEDDFKGDDSDPEHKTGLAALADIDEISLLCCPDEYYVDPTKSVVAKYLVVQCETLKYRFAILQARQNPLKPASHDPSQPSPRGYAAYYTPWLKLSRPGSGTPISIPPGGHIAGIYARSDIERGVHKDPANEIVRGIDELQIQIGSRDQETLNPKGVNAIRYFRGFGNLVWGGRTTSKDPDWKYINVRRLFIFVEKSIEQATQWVVFEPNDEPLWARVRRSVSDFLTRLWMDGMLQGRSKEEAYFVKCDRTTMTQADIDNGKLIMVIGIAPVKPAEFVIFRIGQWTGGSEVTE